jgi:hypothetical protein
VKRQRGANYEDPIRSIGDDDVLRIFRDIVTFHGEMVLLENYSSLNYTGVSISQAHRGWKYMSCFDLNRMPIHQDLVFYTHFSQVSSSFSCVLFWLLTVLN